MFTADIVAKFPGRDKEALRRKWNNLKASYKSAKDELNKSGAPEPVYYFQDKFPGSASIHLLVYERCEAILAGSSAV